MTHVIFLLDYRKFDTHRLMLMLLRVATGALDPGIILAHFLRLHPHHGVRNAVGPTQRVEIGDGFLDR